MKEDYQKALKKLILFFFRTKSLLMDEVIKLVELVTSRSSGYKTRFFKNSFISYILLEKAWWYNIKQFLSYSKNYINKFMQANSWHLNYFASIRPFESGKFGKEGKSQKFEYLKNEKSFLNEIKTIFKMFLKGYHLVKK